ncbi:MAG: hypothetical protein FJ138_09570, partial [Deltaproteobacteria bacterium]|nr:hypothetical protein [Deltaproteobacteria bacterium]
MSWPPRAPRPLLPPRETPARLTSGLNDEQRAAVLHGDGPALLLAGAGSGKTRALTHRVAALIARGAAPWRILALTFTNKAAKEMRERAAALAPEAARVTLTTFHAFGAALLRRHAEVFGRTDAFTIYDQDDQLKLLREVTRAAGLTLEPTDLDALNGAIERAKHEGEGGERAASPYWERKFPQAPPAHTAAGLGASYDDALRAANAFDFGDLIVRPLQALQDPARQAEARARWRWVLVDEFQDTNAAQLRLLQALCPPDGDLLVVGDDDQSIYGWRGADVSNILDFTRYFPSAATYKLQQNYRSRGNILKAANGVIARNQARLGKRLWTTADDGAKVTLYHAKSDLDEADYVAREIRALLQSGSCVPADVAVLYRANHLTLAFERSFAKPELRVPYRVVRGQAFFERAEVKDALSYLRLMVNPRDA